MQLYIGTKLIAATPMTRMDYLNLRGWDLPLDEEGTDEGYLVEYLDSNNPNVRGYANYVSWSPKNVFKDAYHTTGEMTYGDALELLKRGYKMVRSGWNGNGMCVYLVSADLPYFALLKPTGAIQIGWVASVGDSLANDWCVVE